MLQLLHMYSNKNVVINAEQTSKTNTSDMQVNVVYMYVAMKYKL